MNKYMEYAYKEAIKADKKNEIPVGAVIVKDNIIISKAHNTRQTKNLVLGHAEINAIIKAEKKIGDWRLDNCDLYVTLAPCEMCQSVISESRIKNVFYLIENNNVSKNNINVIRTNDCVKMKNEYKKMVESFFEKLRK